jgi:hypothetical protein
MLVRFVTGRGGEAMAVILVHQGPTLTKDKYDEIVRRFSEGRGRMESPSDWPVPGLLSHAAGEAPSGFRVVDVWESEEAAKRFGDILMPTLREIGVTDEPEVYPAHGFVHA